MTDTLTRTTTYYILDCPTCGILFGISAAYDDRRRQDCKSFYCPSGHSMSYDKQQTDKERIKRLEREVANANEFARMETARANQLKAEAARVKRELTKTRKRAEAALCPVPGCQRSFVQMERHLRSKHPEFVHARDGH